MLTLPPALTTGNADIDRHHADFLDALNAVGAASGDAVLAALDQLQAHCEVHFTFENEQMKASNFPPIGCHLGEHDMVTETVRAVRQRVAAGYPEIAQSLEPALTQWFENHVQSMDAVLALYLAQPPENWAAAPAGAASASTPACGVPAEDWGAALDALRGAERV